MSREQLSTVVSQTSRKNERGDIRRGLEGKHPELGFNGCRTLYEGFRRGHQLNPLGACLGFRAISTNGLATPFIYSSYTEILARVNAFAAGIETLNLVPPTKEDNMVLLGLYMKNCMEWFIAEHAIFCVSGATGKYINCICACFVRSMSVVVVLCFPFWMQLSEKEAFLFHLVSSLLGMCININFTKTNCKKTNAKLIPPGFFQMDE